MNDIWPDRLTLPLLVGVTGHRDVLPGAAGAVRDAVRAALRALGGDAQAARNPGRLAGLHVLTALAEGADQLVAEVALELGIPLVAVLPMPLDRYRETMAPSGQATLDTLWNHPGVVLQLELPIVSPGASPPDETPTEASARQDMAQYEQLGILLARQSHILLALWNGEDAEPLGEDENWAAGRARRVRGGSAHVVKMRLAGERNEVSADALRATPLLAETPPLLDLAPRGPVLQVVTPRQKDAGAVCKGADDVVYPAGTLLWGSDLPPRHDRPAPLWRMLLRLFWPPHEVHPVWQGTQWQLTAATRLPELLPQELRNVAALGADLAEQEGMDPDICRRNGRNLCPDAGANGQSGGLDALPSEATAPLRWLRRMFAAADADAVHFQKLVLGPWSPGLFPRGRWWWPMGALLVFAVVVPLAALFFELYATRFHEHEPDAPWWLAGYLALVLGALAYYSWKVRRLAWQSRAQDHRAFAEALRVQFFWALAGVPVAVSDNYLGQHGDMLGWIRMALRGPAIWATAAALKMDGRPVVDLLRVQWLENQRGFFQARGGQDARAEVWMQRGARLCVTVLVAVAAVQLMLHLGSGAPFHLDPLHYTPVVMGVLPALAAFFVITAEGRAYEAHAHAYARGALLFSRAVELADTLADRSAPERAAAWRTLVLALGREALDENAAWLEAHRARPVASRTG